VVFCDNVSAVYLSTNPVQHQRTKHGEIDLHFVRDKVATGEIRVLHVPSTSQYADVFTKGLPTSLFTEFRSSLNVSTPSSVGVPTEGGVSILCFHISMSKVVVLLFLFQFHTSPYPHVISIYTLI
jgi:hypothetical protein